MEAVLQAPCDNNLIVEEAIRKELWLIKRKDTKKIIVTEKIDDKSYLGFIRVRDVIKGELLLVPIHTIDIIKRRDVLGIFLKCLNRNNDSFLYFYDLPCSSSYRLDKYGLEPFDWKNIESIEEFNAFKKDWI